MDSEASIQVSVERFDNLLCAHCDAALDISQIDPFTRIECPKCGQPATVPAKLGNFLLLDIIGTGGMGGVFIAEDQSLGRLVAIKVMLPSFGEKQGSVDAFTHEAQAAARLNHPNIAQIYSIGQERGQPYIVMELVAGQSLDDLIEQGRPLKEALIVRVGLGMAGALQAAEEAGLTHGDIKPENILFDEKGNPKLVDFGLAALSDQAAAEGVWGTPYYIAPEKVLRQKADSRADIYSLGATLYHALTGKPPFDGKTPGDVVRARLERNPKPLRQVRRGINPHVAAIVGRMLEREPARRYPTYASLISDLRKVYEDLPARDRGERIKKRTSHKLSVTTGRLPRVTQAIQSPEIAAEPPGERPRIVIRSKRSRASGSSKRSPEKRIMSKQGRVDTGKRSEAKPPPPKSRRKFRWSILVLLTAGAIAGLVYGVHARNQRQMAARREVFALRDQREAAVAAFAEFEKGLAELEVIAIEADELVAAATSAYLDITESPFIAAVDDSYPDSRPADTADDAGGDATAGGAEPEPPATGVDAPQEEGPAIDSLEIGDLVPVIIAARNRVRVQINDTGMLSQAASQSLARSKVALTSVLVSNEVLAIQKLTAQTAQIRKTLEDVMTPARKAAARVSMLRGEVVAAREAEARGAREAEAAQAAALAKRQAAEKRQALIDAELATVEATHNEAMAFVKDYRFEAARQAARDALDTLQTEAGHEAMSILEERYSELAALKKFLITQLNTNPHNWIWGSGRTAKDVTGANDKRLQIKGGQTVAWSEVSAAQMIKFINAYTSDSKVRIRQQCTQLVAAAIFCLEYAGRDAAPAARSYVNRAVMLCPDVLKKANRLVDFDSFPEEPVE